MTTIYVKSRADIEGGFYPPNGSAVLISISNIGNEIPVCDEQYTAQSHFIFDDADIQDNSSTQLITTLDAQQITEFAKVHVDNGIDSIVVNCEAGQSRSAGCAAALSKIHNDDDTIIINTKPLYNRKVYREILHIHYGPLW